MTASSLLSRLHELGVEVKVSGDDRLIIDAPKGAVTPELRSALASHKPELLQILKAEQTAGLAVAAKPIEPVIAEIEEPAQPVRAELLAAEEEVAHTATSDEISRLETELMRLRTEEAARRAEVEAERAAAENALHVEQERWRKAEEDSARRRAEQEKLRIEAEARGYADEESRRRIADQEIARAEEEVKRMRAMEDARRAEADDEQHQAEATHRAELEALARAEAEQTQERSAAERHYLDTQARKRTQEEELRRRAVMGIQAVEEEILRVEAREKARQLAAEEAARLAEEAARRRAEEEARRQAEEETRRRAEEEAHLRAQIEAQMRAEAEAQRQAEAEARRREEEEARRRAEEEAQRLAAEEARAIVEAEAQRRAEEESRRQVEEEARRRAEAEAQRAAEDQARLQVEEVARQRAEAHARERAEMEARIRAEVEAKLRAEEAERRQTEEARLGAEHKQIERRPADAEVYPFEVERAEVAEPAVAKVNEIVEWFDATSAGKNRATEAADHFAALDEEIAGEFHPVSVPDAPAFEGAPVSPGTLSQLGSEKAGERAVAVADLARFGGEESFRHINAAFDDPALEVRSAAARALFAFQEDRAAAYTRALREAAPDRRRRIGAAIASSGLANEAVRNLTGESRDKTYDAFSLLFLMSKAGEVQPLMRAIEEHPNIEVRLAVVKLLALSGQPDILPSFRRMAVRGSLPPEVRSAVMEAIYQITSQTPADEPSVV